MCSKIVLLEDEEPAVEPDVALFDRQDLLDRCPYPLRTMWNVWLGALRKLPILSCDESVRPPRARGSPRDYRCNWRGIPASSLTYSRTATNRWPMFELMPVSTKVIDQGRYPCAAVDFTAAFAEDRISLIMFVRIQEIIA